jgi:hypothetical protein
VRIAAVLPVVGLLCVASLASTTGCTSIDPGPDYVVPPEDFSADYFYCFVEPNLIFGKKCGDDGSHGCHYSDKVPGMALTDHEAVTCTNGHPTDTTMIGGGSAASNNLSAVSIEMSTDYTTAPLYIYPTQLVGAGAHPKQVFTPSDPVVKYIATWATAE